MHEKMKNLDITSIKKIKPLYSKVLTTMNLYSNEVINNEIIDTTKNEGSIKEYQVVVAVGDMVRNIKVGDIVMINPERYAVKKHKEGSLKDGVITDNPVISYNFPIMDLNGIPHLYLNDNDIEYIIEEYETSSDIEV